MTLMSGAWQKQLFDENSVITEKWLLYEGHNYVAVMDEGWTITLRVYESTGWLSTHLTCLSPASKVSPQTFGDSKFRS